MELTRKQVIEELKAILEIYWNVPLSKSALEYAISSLKTDEAYQLMYEGGEVYTKADIANILENLLKEIAKLKSYESSDGQDLAMLADIGILFNQRINELKEEDEKC